MSLLFVVLASIVVVAALLCQVANAQDATIEFSAPAGGDQVVDAQLESASAQADSHPGLMVKDPDGVVWVSSCSRVELFKKAYAGLDGEAVTVDTADGSKLIAPGTSNVYDFTVSNTHDFDIAYSLSGEGAVIPSGVDIPIEVHVQYGDIWVIGGKNAWVPLSELGEINGDVTLRAHTTHTYRLGWRWAFEDESDPMRDRSDTGLGNMGDLASVSVNLHARAWFDDSSLDEGGTEVGAASFGRGVGAMAQTGDIRFIGFAALLALGFVAGIAAVLLIRGSRREDGE